MTSHEYIQYLRSEFDSGKSWVEIKADEPRKLYTNLRYKSYECKLHWRFQVLENSLIVRLGPQPKEAKKKQKPKQCTCGDYHKCMECRNREKRRAFRAGEVPAYRLATSSVSAGDD